jgi:hypothetical protein
MNRGKGLIKVKASGTANDITVEAMAIIGEIYRGIRKNNQDSADNFRLNLITFLFNEKALTDTLVVEGAGNESENSAIDE